MSRNFNNGSIKITETAEKYIGPSSTYTSQKKENSGMPSAVKKRTSNYINDWDSFLDNIKWFDTIALIILHIIAIWVFTNAPYIQKFGALIYMIAYGFFAGLGVTASAHRYWTHRTYKANTPMKILLTMMFLAAGQNTILHWARDHRVHHKFSETDADPYNSRRGFFFAHVGWLMLRKHPEVVEKGKQIDMSDIENDPIAAFSVRYYKPLVALFVFILPTAIPVLLWNESLFWASFGNIARYVYVLNATWCVNSFAHLVGNRPYNKDIQPVENKFVGYVAFGEGWHNYHHVFPYDYRAAELGGDRVNLTTRFIDYFAKYGWVYDRKTPSDSVVYNTIVKKGDGTHELAETLAEKLKVENVQNDSNESRTKGF